MADPRETARAWLAEVLFQRCPGCTVDDAAASGMSHVRRAEAEYLADAILPADGVEVVEQRGPGFVPTGALVDHGSINGPDPEHVLQMFTQVVIRLPAQPIGETP